MLAAHRGRKRWGTAGNEKRGRTGDGSKMNDRTRGPATRILFGSGMTRSGRIVRRMQLSPSSAIDETVHDRGSYRPTVGIPLQPRHVPDLRKEFKAGSGEGKAIKE
ncbi:hypothetical protein Hypma_004498 [Hypsizygus marmoreus]|uniref:Uncharacterized protein n=1 Tax=Hypsizygus marmoreus TaxID=39966 RepID=A0A369K3M1_HYPMA|nr:hypothetical protein Hypma_004495 [Hypsizygus marmoreus]RDB27238.1 hypothetical protein Hypma_004498 [Hypsizygus marmoreus]